MATSKKNRIPKRIKYVSYEKVERLLDLQDKQQDFRTAKDAGVIFPRGSKIPPYKGQP